MHLSLPFDNPLTNPPSHLSVTLPTPSTLYYPLIQVGLKCQAVQEVNQAIKLKFRDEMVGDQQLFVKSLKDLNGAVEVLGRYTDVTDVENICAKVSWEYE